MTVQASQRFRNAASPCPICGGHDSKQRKKGERCTGFLSDDGAWAHCSREESAGSIEISNGSETYGHRMHGPCKCGTQHGAAIAELKPQRKRVVVSYDYTDANGGYVFSVDRLEPKGFRQRVRDSHSVKGVNTRIPYRLPELIFSVAAGDTVYICEGEKDVDSMFAAGLVATCNAGGALKWTAEHAKHLLGAERVCIIADKDERGYQHARMVAETLSTIGVPFEFCEAAQGKDVTDHLAAGLRIRQLTQLDAEALKKPSEEEAQNEFKPYPLLRASDLRPHLKGTYIIKDVLEPETIAMLYGASGTSKSFVALEMSLAIASGRAWRNKRTKPGRVIYVAAEGARGMAKRVYAALDDMGTSDVDLFLVPEIVQLRGDQPDIDRFVRTVLEQSPEGAALVVIDTLARAMPGLDENTSRDMGIAIDAATAIQRQLGCTVLIVHHSGKKEALGARGSGAMRAAIASELELRKDDSKVCTLTVSKQKDLESEGESFLHRLEQVKVGVDEDGDDVTTCLVRPLESEEVAAVRAAKHGGKTSRIALEAVTACIDLHQAKRRERVPANVLAASGYTDWIADQGWSPDVKVWGFSRDAVLTLLKDRFEGADESADAKKDRFKSADESADAKVTENVELDRKEKNRRHQSAKRRLAKSITTRAVWAHDNWVWLSEQPADDC